VTSNRGQKIVHIFEIPDPELPIHYTWDAVTSVNLTCLWSDINDVILCVQQIVYMNKNGGF